MSHRNARLTVHGRQLLVQRVASGRPVAHVAKELGVSRQCAHRWVARHAAEGEAGLADRSSRPHRMSARTNSEVEAKVVAARWEHRRGPDWLGLELGLPARTVSRILRRHQVPYLADCDPLTGQPIRASKQTTCRYERDRPGELVHMDVKKIGKIPDGGGWKALGRADGHRDRKTKIGYHYVHSVVDDHSRLAYSEILPDEIGTNLRGVPAPRRRLLHRPRHHPDRTGDHRQPPVLPAFTGHVLRRRSPGRPAPFHQAPLPLAERQSRAIQPHPPSRVGLPTGVH